MDDHNTSIITIVADLVASYVQRISDLIHLATLEAQLAFRTLILIAMLIFLFGAILTAGWLSVLACLFIYLTSLHFSALTSSLVIVAINAGVLMSIVLVIYRIKKNLFFPSTRQQLQQVDIIPEDVENERLTAEN
jgi:hypothetical protein